jgi:hypothetical protein
MHQGIGSGFSFVSLFSFLGYIASLFLGATFVLGYNFWTASCTTFEPLLLLHSFSQLVSPLLLTTAPLMQDYAVYPIIQD